MHTELVQVKACATLVSTLICAEAELFICLWCVVCSQQKATLHHPLFSQPEPLANVSPPEVNTSLRITQPSL